MGMERVTSVLQDKGSNYATDIFSAAPTGTPIPVTMPFAVNLCCKRRLQRLSGSKLQT